MIFEKSMKWRF